MNKKRFWLAMVTTFLFLSITASSWAITELFVVRDVNSNLWKKTCTGLTCSAWASISGRFLVQPTLIWDGYLKSYVLTGVGMDGGIYRSTFDINGNHDNVWVAVGGSTPSPVAAAAKVWVPNAEAIYSTTGVPLSGTVTNLLSISWLADEVGFVLVKAWAQLHVYHVAGTTTIVNFHLSSTPGGSDIMNGHYFIEPAHPTGYQCIPISISRFVPVSAGAASTYYFTANFSGAASASASAADRSMDIQYFYY